MTVAPKKLQRNRALENESSPSQSGEFPIVSTQRRRSIFARGREWISTTYEGAKANLAKPDAEERWDTSDFESVKYGPKVVAFPKAKKEDPEAA